MAFVVNTCKLKIKNSLGKLVAWYYLLVCYYSYSLILLYYIVYIFLSLRNVLSLTMEK